MQPASFISTSLLESATPLPRPLALAAGGLVAIPKRAQLFLARHARGRGRR